MFSTFSVHYPSITEYRFGRPTTDGNHLYETPVISLFLHFSTFQFLYFSNRILHFSIFVFSLLSSLLCCYASIYLSMHLHGKSRIFFMCHIVENDKKKRGVRIFEKFVWWPFNSFLSLPTCPGLNEKNATLLSIWSQTKEFNSQNTNVFTQKEMRNKTFDKRNTIKKSFRMEKSPFCSPSKKVMQQ